jgi:hypothetical protein
MAGFSLSTLQKMLPHTLYKIGLGRDLTHQAKNFANNTWLAITKLIR